MSVSVQISAIEGIPEVSAGDDLAGLIIAALEAKNLRLEDGDIVVVTSKIVSKAEGRKRNAQDREEAISAETVRIVATREHAAGITRIVENRQGIVQAAAGVDASNTPAGTVLLLPLDPDASARALAGALREHFGVLLGVLLSDTLGRAWREGQIDAAIGAAGVQLIADLRGTADVFGQELTVTQMALADEIASATDLVKGKAQRTPVALVRGLSELVCQSLHTPARSLNRPAAEDLFRLGSDEAHAQGYAEGYAAASLSPSAKNSPDISSLRWCVVIPVKQLSEAKSRLGIGLARRRLALAFAQDTVAAVRSCSSVSQIVLVTSDTEVIQTFSDSSVVIVPDPGSGLNAAFLAGARAAKQHPHDAVAAITADLPALKPSDLFAVLQRAAQHSRAMVADRAGSGTTLITALSSLDLLPQFGCESAQRHQDAGHVLLSFLHASAISCDVDTPEDLKAATEWGLGAHTQRAIVEVLGEAIF